MIDHDGNLLHALVFIIYSVTIFRISDFKSRTSRVNTGRRRDRDVRVVGAIDTARTLPCYVELGYVDAELGEGAQGRLQVRVRNGLVAAQEPGVLERLRPRLSARVDGSPRVVIRVQHQILARGTLFFGTKKRFCYQATPRLAVNMMELTPWEFHNLKKR